MPHISNSNRLNKNSMNKWDKTGKKNVVKYDPTANSHCVCCQWDFIYLFTSLFFLFLKAGKSIANQQLWEYNKYFVVNIAGCLFSPHRLPMRKIDIRAFHFECLLRFAHPPNADNWIAVYDLSNAQFQCTWTYIPMPMAPASASTPAMQYKCSTHTLGIYTCVTKFVVQVQRKRIDFFFSIGTHLHFLDRKK